MKIDHRDKFPDLLNDLQLNGFGVEIGVWQGTNSEHLLRHSKLKLLYSVDAWHRQFIKPSFSDEDIQNAYHSTLKKLIPYSTRSFCIVETSLKAAQLFPDNYFDFVYIDAQHDYESIKNDIAAWWPKVKSNGIFAGHDYAERLPNWEGGKSWGVIKAVNEHISQYKLQLCTTTETNPSWYCLKSQHLNVHFNTPMMY